MSNIALPSSLPAPLVGSSFSIADSTFSSRQPSTALLKRSFGFGVIPILQNLRYRFNETQFNTFMDFFNSTLGYGNKYYQFSLAGRSMLCKIIDGYVARPVDNEAKIWEVSFNVIMLDFVAPEPVARPAGRTSPLLTYICEHISIIDNCITTWVIT